jgi:hypothetical protein
MALTGLGFSKMPKGSAEVTQACRIKRCIHWRYSGCKRSDSIFQKNAPIQFSSAGRIAVFVIVYLVMRYGT